MDLIDRILSNVDYYWTTISIFDVVDVIIIAFLIYKLLMLVRRTSTGGVLRGVALLLIALWVSAQFHLNVLNFLLTRAVELGMLAIVVVFQPEIRRVLEQMGHSNLSAVFTRNGGTSELENAITETVQAYTSLSKDKIGALTVFERKISLNESIKSGTPMDCSVSSELMKNIFWPKAPLHDGAVIVREGRIVGAGCMLPLSSNVNLSRDLGMRHRAGIGASEHTDAVVAIVSEETGSISVAVGGMLKRHLAPETLERLLRNELLPRPEEEKRSIRALRPVAWLLNRKEGRKND